jgi:hypothetical protein
MNKNLDCPYIIQLDDPFTYDSLNDLINAIISPSIPISSIRRPFDSEIIQLLDKMMVKVLFLFVYVICMCVLFLFLEDPLARVNIIDVLNNKRILKSIDDNCIEMPESLWARVKFPKKQCAKFIFIIIIIIIHIYIFVIN